MNEFVNFRHNPTGNTGAFVREFENRYGRTTVIKLEDGKEYFAPSNEFTPVYNSINNTHKLIQENKHLSNVVDWLLYELAIVNRNLDEKVFLPAFDQQSLASKTLNRIFETAKKMHEKQIKEAYNQGYRDAEIDCFHVSAHDISTYGNAQKYYNEMFII